MKHPEFIAIPELCEELGGITAWTVRVHIRKGHIPEPIRLTGRCVFWRRSDLIEAGVLPREEVRS